MRCTRKSRLIAVAEGSSRSGTSPEAFRAGQNRFPGRAKLNPRSTEYDGRVDPDGDDVEPGAEVIGEGLHAAVASRSAGHDVGGARREIGIEAVELDEVRASSAAR